MSEPEDSTEGGLFDDIQLEILCNMDDPPAEAFETSWLRAKELLDKAGPSGAILVLTITESGEDLASSVVLSSGYAQVPTNYILEILDHHLEGLGEE